MSSTWQAAFFAVAIVAAVIGMIVIPRDRMARPSFWLLLWAVLVTSVWLSVAWKAAAT